MRFIYIILALILCLTLISFNGCLTGTGEAEIVIEDTAVGGVPQDPNYIYPQTWATGNGTASSPWAGDCIDKAIAAASTGDTIYLRAGYYQLSGQCTITKPLNIIGEGIGKTIVLTDDAKGFYNDGHDYVSIKNLTVDGDAQADNSTNFGVIFLNNCDYATIENVEVKNGGYYGIGMYQTNHSLTQNLLLHNNYRHGMEYASNISGRNMYNTTRNIDTYNNGVCGFTDRGNGEAKPLVSLEACYNTFDNIRTWGNTNYGFVLSYQKNAKVSNCSATNNKSAGFRFVGLQDTDISNCIVTENGVNKSFGGIFLSGSNAHSSYISKNVNFTNCISKNNDKSGIDLYDYVYDITFTSCEFFDDRETPVQKFGMKVLLPHIEGVTLTNCTLTPNVTADIYNPYNVAINIITENNFCSIFKYLSLY